MKYGDKMLKTSIDIRFLKVGDIIQKTDGKKYYVSKVATFNSQKFNSYDVEITEIVEFCNL